MKRIFPTLCGVLLFAWTAFAKDFENGNFADGKSPWLGGGTVVYLKPDGTESETEEPESVPVAKIKLNKTQFREISQKFETQAGTGSLKVEVVYKGSADFQIQEKSNQFTKGNTFEADGTTYYRGTLVSPKADLCARLDTPGSYAYKLAKVQPGADWKTLKITWTDVGEKKDVKLSILAPPGEGTLWIKSVSVSK